MRPLILCDCDEVLLQFATPFAEHLADAHDIELRFERFALAENIRYRDSREPVSDEDVPDLLDDFFRNGLRRQHAVPGAAEALAALAGVFEIVVLTNIRDEFRKARTEQIAAAGMPYRVICNSGPKGPALRRLIAEYGATDAIFIDDLPHHHESVAQASPQTYRVHMVADSRLRTLVDAAPHAHVRIDEWRELFDHLTERHRASASGYA